MPDIQTITSPSGQTVRIAGGRVLLTDLGPAMGRSRPYMNRVMANNPPLQAVALKLKVGGRDGWTFGEDGVRLLLATLKGLASRGEMNGKAYTRFMDWGERDLLNAIRTAGVSLVPVLPRRILIDLDEEGRFQHLSFVMNDGQQKTFRP